MIRLQRLVAALFLAAGTACASSGGGAGGGASAATPKSDPNTITAADLEKSNLSNLYDYIRQQRPLWLRSRGSTTIAGTEGDVNVYLDQTRLGGPETLREFQLSGIKVVRYYSASAAQQRFGENNTHGAIQVITR